ncbi:hypothetical protein ACH5RR_028643 [Cinchona calisaya]|uniref:Uncharacterized protein n=1 Tax=Cinchona calisaya TaxID=153742 RepID=A0ABD2YSP7_9GENT
MVDLEVGKGDGESGDKETSQEKGKWDNRSKGGKIAGRGRGKVLGLEKDVVRCLGGGKEGKKGNGRGGGDGRRGGC